MEDDRGLYKDKVTDQASRFRKWGATAEKTTMELENEHRAIRKLITDLEGVLKKYQPTSWNFAAPEEINKLIMDGLHAEFKEMLQHNLKKDLINILAKDLAAYFEKKA